jgi:rRNA maturation RNase YbeY
MKGEDCLVNEISLNFINDTKIREINKKYLDHNYSTDVVTFWYNNSRKNVEGEIFISLDTVKYNGSLYKEGFKRELERVIIHGCLHLAGYNDRTKKEMELIRSKEEFYLSS